MAAGLSRKQITRRIYNRLQSIRYELSKAGVETVYERATSTKDASVVWFDEKNLGLDGGFNITYNVNRASNGETFGMARIMIAWSGTRLEYGIYYPESYEQGMTRIKQLFSGRTL